MVYYIYFDFFILSIIIIQYIIKKEVLKESGLKTPLVRIELIL